MKKLYAILLLCCGINSLVTAQEYPVRTWHAEDTEMRQKAQNLSQRLPSSLDQYWPWLDAVLTDMDGRYEKKKKAQEAIRYAQNAMTHIYQGTEKAKTQFAQVNQLYQHLETLANNERTTAAQYAQQRKHFTDAYRAFSKQQKEVIRKEKRTLGTIVWYLRKNLISEDTLVITSLIRHVLDTIRTTRTTIVQNKGMVDSLDRVIQANKSALHTLYAARDSLNRVQTRYNDSILALTNLRDNLHNRIAVIREENTHLLQTKDTVQGALTRIRKVADGLKTQIAQKERALGSIRSAIAGKEVELTTVLHYWGDAYEASKRYATVSDSLKLFSQQLIEAQKDENRANRNKFSFLILSILFALAAAFFYARKNASIRKKNREIGQINGNLALAITHLEDKKKALENLVREAHHRIKNHLIDISYTIEEQIALEHNPVVREALRDVRLRTEAMAIIHKKLHNIHEEGSLKKINIADSVRDLAASLLHMGRQTDRIAIRFDMDALAIDMNLANYIMLVYNELLQNAMKHAFKSDNPADPALFVALKRDPRTGLLELQVRDNGPGLPPRFLWSENTPSTFGLHFVRMMAEGREGSTSAVNAPDGRGAVFTVTLMPNSEEVDPL